MNDGAVVSGLLALTIALFLPMGFRRGGVREVFATAGLLAGAMLANSWARPWGTDLAGTLNISSASGAFIFSCVFLIAGYVVFGYWAASIASLERPSRRAQFAGALLAAVNGTILIALILRDIERFYANSRTLTTLRESWVAWNLLRQFGWVLIGAAGLGVALTLLGKALGEGRDPDITRYRPPVAGPVSPAASRPHRLKWGRDDGKVEPLTRRFDPVSERYLADAPSHLDTIPLATADAGAFRNDIRFRESTSGPEWREVRVNDAQSAVRCDGCGERITSKEAFCPRCGRATRV